MIGLWLPVILEADAIDFAHSTPAMPLPLLADPEASGQGFLARFLIVEPASHNGTRLKKGHETASEMAVDRFATRIKTILETQSGSIS